MIQITVNDKAETTTATHLYDLLKIKGLTDEKAIAVALNQDVISKEEWATTPLAESDQVLIIKPTQGG